MHALSRILVLVLVASCCKTMPDFTQQPVPKAASLPLIEQYSPGYCRIAPSRDTLGTSGDVVEITVDSVYYGIFLINARDSLLLACKQGAPAFFKVNTAAGKFIDQVETVVPPLTVKTKG